VVLPSFVESTPNRDIIVGESVSSGAGKAPTDSMIE
jgi:hypothetical protein